MLLRSRLKRSRKQEKTKKVVASGLPLVYSVFVIDTNPKGDKIMSKETVEEFLKRGGVIATIPSKKAVKEVKVNIGLLKEKASR